MARRGGNLASVPRETGCPDHEHPLFPIGWRIRHLQLQGDLIGLAECQNLKEHFQKNTESFNV